MSEKRPFTLTYTSPERKAQPAPGQRPDHPITGNAFRPVLKAVLWGVASCLLFGLGLTFVLEWSLFVPGVLCGLLGIAGTAVAPALYGRWNKRITEEESSNAS